MPSFLPVRASILLAACLLLVAAGDLLCWGVPPGLGLALVLVAACAGTCLRFPGLLTRPGGCCALGLAVAMAAAQTVDAGLIAPILGASALLVAAALARGAALHCDRLVPGALGILARALPRACLDTSLATRHGLAWRNLRHLVAWILPLGIGGLFLGLFAIANPLVEHALDAVWNWLVNALFDLPAPLRILLWCGLGVGFWGLWRARPRWRAEAPASTRDLPDRSRHVRHCLLVCNAVFLLQLGLDGAVLVGGASLPEGLSHAAYAHRGAYPLLATALLAATFVLAWFRPGAPAGDDRFNRWLVQAWVAQNVVLLATAVWRLHLYVDAFGLTRWRFAAALWMLLVAVGLGLLAWRIAARFGNRWLLDANALACALLLAVCAFVDFDGIIAWHDARTAREVGGAGQPLDSAYLRSLGPAAIPALRWFATYAGEAEAARMAELTADEATTDLRACASWRSWTWRRASWAAEPVQPTNAAASSGSPPATRARTAAP